MRKLEKTFSHSPFLFSRINNLSEFLARDLLKIFHIFVGFMPNYIKSTFTFTHNKYTPNDLLLVINDLACLLLYSGRTKVYIPLWMYEYLTINSELNLQTSWK